MEKDGNKEYYESDGFFAKMSVCVAGAGSSYFLVNNVAKYYGKLTSALSDIKSHTECDYLYFSFIALASATLEFSLNSLYAHYFFDKFGGEESGKYAKIYQSLNFKNKLFMLPQIMLDNSFVLNEDDANVKNLYELISLRNKILHNSENVQELDFPDLGGWVEDGNLYIPLDNTNDGVVEFTLNIKDNIIDTLTPELCIRLGDSLVSFYSTFMLEYFNCSDITNSNFIRKI